MVDFSHDLRYRLVLIQIGIPIVDVKLCLSHNLERSVIMYIEYVVIVLKFGHDEQ